MEYVNIFITVFMVIGARAFQQKVVAANNYPGMGIVGCCIYMGEGTAVLLITKGGTLYHVIPGAIGAGLGVMSFVYLYNRFFNNRGTHAKSSSLASPSGTNQETQVR